MKKKIDLPNVTLAAVSSVKLPQTIKALQYSMRGINFGEVTLITDQKPWYLPSNITYQHIDKIDNINKFNYFMVYDIHKYIHKDYMLLVHYDGYVVNPLSWSDQFLEYDYIGAPWLDYSDNPPPGFTDADGDVYRVGNSVSIRSKRLMELPEKLGIEWKAFDGLYHEDGFICIQNHKLLEKNGCRFAPVELAAQFSREYLVPEGEGVVPFCFHKWTGENSKYPKFTPIPLIRR